MNLARARWTPCQAVIALSQSLQTAPRRQWRAMQVRDGMSEVVLTVGPGHTLRQAASLMAGRGVGAAVVMDPEAPGPGIITERDLLDAIARIEPPMTMTIDVVMPTSAMVMPTVRSSGWMLGPWRWISSPAGGTSGSSGLMRCRWRPPRTSCRT